MVRSVVDMPYLLEQKVGLFFVGNEKGLSLEHLFCAWTVYTFSPQPPEHPCEDVTGLSKVPKSLRQSELFLWGHAACEWWNQALHGGPSDSQAHILSSESIFLKGGAQTALNLTLRASQEEKTLSILSPTLREHVISLNDMWPQTPLCGNNNNNCYHHIDFFYKGRRN